MTAPNPAHTIDPASAERMRRYAIRWDAVILHCPGPERVAGAPVAGEWAAACCGLLADNDLRGRFRDVDDLTVVTYNTRAEPSLLERCAAHLGLSRIAVLGRHLRRWQWSDKIELVHHYLESGACTTQYVLCLDGDDVLIIGDPALALERFREADCDILFGGTRGDWPPSPECAAFEAAAAGGSNLRHCHLNAGGYLARTSGLAPRLRALMAAIDGGDDWCRAEHGFDDQLAWRQLHRRQHPGIRVDVGCRVFLRFDDER